MSSMIFAGASAASCGRPKAYTTLAGADHARQGQGDGARQQVPVTLELGPARYRFLEIALARAAGLGLPF